MRKNFENALVIAQKEFADRLLSPRFIALLLICTIILFSFSYRAGMGGRNVFGKGFLDVAQIIALFLPMIGIAIGFDAIVKERKLSSLNVLLTHPVFRDTVIAGKLLGSMATLALVVGISVVVSVGTILVVTGVQVTAPELSRVLIFMILTFLYISTFLGIGVLVSIFSKSTTDSLIYGIVIWINLVIVFSAIVIMVASIATGQSYLELDDNQHVLDLNIKLQRFSPIHHYAETVTGHPSLSWGGVSVVRGNVGSSGIFDTGHTLEQWLWEYWTNLAVLIVTPIILFIVSIIIFLRRDITM